MNGKCKRKYIFKRKHVNIKYILWWDREMQTFYNRIYIYLIPQILINPDLYLFYLDKMQLKQVRYWFINPIKKTAEKNEFTWVFQLK